MIQPPGFETVPLAHPARSRPGVAWAFLGLIALVAVVAMSVFFLQRQHLSTRLGEAEQRLASVRGALAASRATVENLQGQLRGMREDVAGTVETVDRCRAGIRAMVRLWNRHTEELAVAEEGSAAALAAAHERTEAAREVAERAVRRCQS